MQQLILGRDGAARARWLAELSTALDEAAGLLQRLGVTGDDSPTGIELHLRIEQARFAARALQLGRDKRALQVSGPKWIEPVPWPVRS